MPTQIVNQKYVPVEKQSSQPSGLLAGKGIILAKAVYASSEAKPHGYTNKYDNKTCPAEQKDKERGTFFCHGSIYFVFVESSSY